MIYGIGLLVLPIALFLASLPLSGKLPPGLRKFYLWSGGTVPVAGGGISIYFAGYTGEQGGITAFFFQLGVIAAYLLLTLTVALIALIKHLSKP